MPHAIIHAVLSGLGMLWLLVRYPDKEKREEVFTEKYKGNYVNAGKGVFLVFVITVFVYELLVEFI